uniref:Androgen dependent TFPI regulating protein n=1 Tax=Myripristis murdjan TaxID=586833 RepID=A0A667XI18_9TELE
ETVGQLFGSPVLFLVHANVFIHAPFSWYAFIVKSLAAKDGEDLPPGIFVYGGPWKYLTFLNLVSLLQMVFFGLAAVNDFQPGKKSENFLQRCTDLLFSVFAFPVGMFVVLLFWTIFAYDRELVYPATIDAFFPPWINHAMHSFVLPILLGEIMMFSLGWHTISANTSHDVLSFPSAFLNLLCRVIWVYLSVGIWVYPLLGLFSKAGLMGFFFFNMSVVTLLYLLGEKLNSYIWCEDKSKNKMKAKRK